MPTNYCDEPIYECSELFRLENSHLVDYLGTYFEILRCQVFEVAREVSSFWKCRPSYLLYPSVWTYFQKVSLVFSSLSRSSLTVQCSTTSVVFVGRRQNRNVQDVSLSIIAVENIRRPIGRNTKAIADLWRWVSSWAITDRKFITLSNFVYLYIIVSTKVANTM